MIVTSVTVVVFVTKRIYSKCFKPDEDETSAPRFELKKKTFFAMTLRYNKQVSKESMTFASKAGAYSSRAPSKIYSQILDEQFMLCIPSVNYKAKKL